MAAMTQEEQDEYTQSIGLLSADELRAQLGDDPEQDKLIQQVLDNGKAVEMKQGTAAPAAEFTEETDPDGHATGKDVADEADEDDDDAGAKAETSAAAAEPQAAAAEADATAADTAAAADAAAAAPTEAELADQLAAIKLDLTPATAQYDARIAELDAQSAAKLADMMDGKIDAAEYSKFQSQYLRDRDAAAEERRGATDWLTSTHQFMQTALKESGINYGTDTSKLEAWDAWIKRLAENPAHGDKPADWFLREAHRKVMVEFDIAPRTAATAPATPKTPEKPAGNVADGKKVAKTNGRAPNLDAIPPTLGGINSASAATAEDGGEFAHLDKLTGMAYEQALARLSADQKSRYEAM